MMADKPGRRSIDTVVVGNGPSALILSYILHGNIPYYDSTHPHPDPILHDKLIKSSCLLDIDIAALTAHFSASRLSYSTQALPVNVLLDTLIRPLADTEPGTVKSCVRWQYEPSKVVEHAVLGNAKEAGGQWAENPVAASWDIGALSYAEMLSLPGYTMTDHLRSLRQVQPAEFYRPTRREVANYFATYPKRVGISDAVWSSSVVRDITRTRDGFYVNSHEIFCRHLVLASGIFSQLVPARPQLQPLLHLPDHTSSLEPPLLVVGSGFTAADIIISNLPKRKIIHIFKWSPEDRPSPLRACHKQAYPEYASVYRRMKVAAIRSLGHDEVFSPLRKIKSNPFFDPPDWENLYEGFANTFIKEVTVMGDKASIALETSTGRIEKREISNLEYVIGRRGSLDYLTPCLRKEVFVLSNPGRDMPDLISGQTLRAKIEDNLEVASNVFVTGSLTGDSLVRFAYGGCVFAAREILARQSSPGVQTRVHAAPAQQPRIKGDENNEYQLTNGHADLGMRTKSRSLLNGIRIRRCAIEQNIG